MRMANWLRNTFRRRDPLWKMNDSTEKNRAHTFAASMRGLGCRVVKRVDGDTMILIDGNTDMPYPDGMGPPWEQQYAGPFAVTTEDDGATIRVGQGYIHAGTIPEFSLGSGATGSRNAAEYDWPARDAEGVATDTDTLDVSGEDDGQHLVYMDIVVDADMGYFTDSYKPELQICAAEAYTARHAGQVILARITVADGVATVVRQDQYGNIRVPVTCKQLYDSDADDFYMGDYAVCATAVAGPFAQASTFDASVDGDGKLIQGTAGNPDYLSIVYSSTWQGGTIPSGDDEINGGQAAEE
jgi:hypothetical protein